MIVQKYRKTTKMQRSVLDEKEFVNERGTEVVKDILGKGVFDYPKSVFLLKRIVALASKSNSIILDFFAGSGTTGQAVLDLNKEDGGNRTFILCTNNEIPSSEKNNKNEVSDNYDPKGIAWSVTSKRLKRVMTGTCYDGSTDFDWIKKNQALGDNLDVYTIESVSNKEQTVGKSPFDVIDETLYGEPKLTPKDKIKWVCENFSVTQKYLDNKKEVN